MECFTFNKIIYLSAMLKFLDNRAHQKPKKSPIKYKPQMIYGISVEAPQQFQTPYTIVHENTYINPYLNFEENRTRRIPQNKAKSLQPKWTHKNNLIQIEEQKIVSSVPEIFRNKINSRYIQTYHAQLNQSQLRFRLTKGQFTNFIEKNNHYKSIGPLHGQQRTQDRIMQTKQSVWFKPESKRGTFLNTSMNTSLKRSESSFSKNSSLITQKQRIRLNRDNFNKKFKETILDRKKSNNSNAGFQLPRIGSQYIGAQTYKNMGTMNVKDTQQQQDMAAVSQLESFQKNLSKKLK